MIKLPIQLKPEEYARLQKHMNVAADRSKQKHPFKPRGSIRRDRAKEPQKSSSLCSKQVTRDIDKEEGKYIMAVTRVHIYKKSGNMSLVSGFQIGKKSICLYSFLGEAGIYT